MSKRKKRLAKGNNFGEAKISGVCYGIAEYFNIDVTIVRFIWAVLALYHGVGVGIYILLAIIMPDKDFG